MKKQEKGITLVALIITIVILLILAGVAISSIQNNGILYYAQNSATSYNEAQKNEVGIIGGYEEYLNNMGKVDEEVEKVECSHAFDDWRDYECNVEGCEYTCEHTCETPNTETGNGESHTVVLTCSNCGFVGRENDACIVENGACTVCLWKCKHPDMYGGSSNDCSECGLHCEHANYTREYEWLTEDEHSFWDECNDCEVFLGDGPEPHTFVDGICKYCAPDQNECTHNWSYGSCKICGKEMSNSEMAFCEHSQEFFYIGGTCIYCGQCDTWD